ncbi:MAG: hypothetical protein J1F31_00800 [Erysipelotrichales bacterium]|nr:hypothetical protein [Erysipelotrichales bacterium]
MKKIVKWFDEAPLIIKIILAIPVLDVVWVVYRIARSSMKESTLGLVLGILLLIIGIPWLWILDIITIILIGTVLWID